MFGLELFSEFLEEIYIFIPLAFILAISLWLVRRRKNKKTMGLNNDPDNLPPLDKKLQRIRWQVSIFSGCIISIIIIAIYKGFF